MKKSTTKALFKDSLFHTYVSILIAEGIPVTKITKMIGDTQEMVMKAYTQSLAYEELKHE
ncbi:hypothetical protein LSP03_10930 [Lysinibacillus sphaericus]|uniref:Integrase n=1 Tax=Lysinibacillus sphaericus TaxID=1421 RepID=A0A2S0K169_LYSSH|nr:hypothetical protein LS41612_12805 [Lysinibacillus sphaericus]GEC81350.1 hypothetical protein LSP03_10930 [Lysinibacillus sphaericus]